MNMAMMMRMVKLAGTKLLFTYQSNTKHKYFTNTTTNRIEVKREIQSGSRLVVDKAVNQVPTDCHSLLLPSLPSVSLSSVHPHQHRHLIHEHHQHQHQPSLPSFSLFSASSSTASASSAASSSASSASQIQKHSRAIVHHHRPELNTGMQYWSGGLC